MSDICLSILSWSIHQHLQSIHHSRNSAGDWSPLFIHTVNSTDNNSGSFFFTLPCHHSCTMTRKNKFKGEKASLLFISLCYKFASPWGLSEKAGCTYKYLIKYLISPWVLSCHSSPTTLLVSSGLGGMSFTRECLYDDNNIKIWWALCLDTRKRKQTLLPFISAVADTVSMFTFWPRRISRAAYFVVSRFLFFQLMAFRKVCPQAPRSWCKNSWTMTNQASETGKVFFSWLDFPFEHNGSPKLISLASN